MKRVLDRENVGVERSTQQQPDERLDYRRRYRGLVGVRSKVPIRDRAILSLVYTPVGEANRR